MFYTSEDELSADYFLLSETDEKGIIVYANNYFSKITGYSNKELVGKSHNIIRHQDVPKEIFKNMWEILKNDKWWNGVVKNKRKNGKYYWVHSVILPIILENGEKGFRSRRRQATQEEITKAEKLYDKIDKGLIC